MKKKLSLEAKRGNHFYWSVQVRLEVDELTFHSIRIASQLAVSVKVNSYIHAADNTFFRNIRRDILVRILRNKIRLKCCEK